jgi:pyruvate formate lyase activating enzyme
MVGEWLTVDQVMDMVRRDSVYYDNSGGGVTFSGGEPTAQPRFLAACAKQCREEVIHTALDTCGLVEWAVLERILPHIDLFLFDLKHMDSQKHERLTGVNNDLILKNLQLIDQQAKPIWIRIPLIPGYNDSEENLGRIAEMVQHLTAVKKISILPYNSTAGAKYRLIGRDYSLERLDYSEEREQEILQIFTTTKINVEIGR